MRWANGKLYYRHKLCRCEYEHSRMFRVIYAFSVFVFKFDSVIGEGDGSGGSDLVSDCTHSR